MPDLADHAYAHTRSVLGDGEAASDAAAVAVRRGGRARWAGLGPGRAEALARAAEASGPDLDGDAPAELTELAAVLAATRPPLERAIVDLDTRHALDRGGFARALGLPVGPAGARAAAVYLDWQRALDPVLLAHLGPGDCDGLAAVLGAAPGSDADADVDGGDDDAGDRDPSATDPLPRSLRGSGGPADPTAHETPAREPRALRELLQLGPIVADHVAGCGRCSDRVRAMVSVRTLL